VPGHDRLYNVAKHAQDNNVPFTDFASPLRAREVMDLIESEIDGLNAGFARVETIKKFRLIEQQLTPRRRGHADHEAQAQVRQREGTRG